MSIERLSARIGLRLSPPAARAALFALSLIAMMALVSVVRAG